MRPPLLAPALPLEGQKISYPIQNFIPEIRSFFQILNKHIMFMASIMVVSKCVEYELNILDVVNVANMH